MAKYPSTFLSFLLLLALQATPLLAVDAYNMFDTKYATMHYAREEDLRQFLWRISGSEIDIHTYPGLAQGRIDRIVEKVQAILDMYPEGFHLDIYVHPAYDRGPIAFYSEKEKKVTAYADRITDNILAHEISHAVIHAYFESPPPGKVREILSQYVDRHLWSE